MYQKKQRRQNQILELLKQLEEIPYPELYARFPQVSQVTIRRDVNELDLQGKLIRKKKSIRRIQTEEDFIAKLHKPNLLPFISELPNNLIDPLEGFETNYKRQIAKAAVDLISNGSRIIIDSGTTTREMINFIGTKKNLAIMTNSLQTSYYLATMPLISRPQILVTGGSYDQISDTFQGNAVASLLQEYNFEQLFIGADGIDFDKGTMTINEGLIYSEVMADISYEVIILIESYKIGRRMRRLELPWNKINTLITDKNITLEDIEKLNALGVTVVVASDTFNGLAKKYQGIRRANVQR